MSDKYKYLFPFEKIPFGSKILIYGAGDVGMECYEQIAISGYCKIVAFLDRAYDKIPKMNISVYSPEKVTELDFDYVLIALKVEMAYEDIKATLVRCGVTENKIVFFRARREVELPQIKPATNELEGIPQYAFEKDGISVAIKYGPGLGDCIIKKKFVVELLKLSDKIHIDLYAPNGRGFIPFFYSDILDRIEVISDGGMIYRSLQRKYDLAMSVFYVVEVDYYDTGKIKNQDKRFAMKVEKLAENCRNYGVRPFPFSQNYIHNGRMRYLGYNYYTMYNYTGIVNITDQVVNVPLNADYESEFRKLCLREYITFNYGNGVSYGNDKSHVSKQWSLKYFETFLQLFKDKYPNINIVQIGDKNTSEVRGADKAFLGLNLETVKHILYNAIFHLDIEAGLVHVASQLGTKCFVLFGPTSVELLGYPQNINITSGDCHGCAGMYDDSFKCARNMKEPECMYSITPELVMEYVDEYFRSINNKMVQTKDMLGSGS